MQYCTRCLYPENFQPSISFDKMGICDGCREHEEIYRINYKERQKGLQALCEDYKIQAERSNNPYNCLIPVSGGKDSQYQVWLMKEVYEMNPLLVCYNHLYNSKVGIRNLRTLVQKSDCPLIRFTPAIESTKRITRMGLEKMGDVTMHYHFGIPSFPAQIAYKYDIPFVILGEPYHTVPGLHTLDEYCDITKSDHGFAIEDFISERHGVTWKDLAPYIPPSKEQLDEMGIRYVFLPSYHYWDGKTHAELLIEREWFEPGMERKRTFNTYEHIDDGVNGTHDYLKYLKFGYGRCTDHAVQEIRFGRMTREQGIELVKEMDAARPDDLDLFLDFIGMTEERFMQCADNLRDDRAWKFNKQKEEWRYTDGVWIHTNDPRVEAARIERTGISDFVELDYGDTCECKLTEDELVIL